MQVLFGSQKTQPADSVSSAALREKAFSLRIGNVHSLSCLARRWLARQRSVRMLALQGHILRVNVVSAQGIRSSGAFLTGIDSYVAVSVFSSEGPSSSCFSVAVTNMLADSVAPKVAQTCHNFTRNL